MPWFNRADNTLEWGAACNGCKVPPGSISRLSRQVFYDAQKQAQVLYSKGEILPHVLKCEKALQVFKAKLKTDIACREKLLPSWHNVCHIAGDNSQKLRAPYLAPGAEDVQTRFRLKQRAEDLERLRCRASRS